MKSLPFRSSDGPAPAAIALLCLLFLASGARPTPAQEPGLPSLFPLRAEVVAPAPTAGGLVRLELPVEVVAACQSDLSDLRLLTPDGRVLPFVTDLGPPAGSVESERRRLPLTIVDVERERSQSGRSLTVSRERYRLEIPDEHRDEVAEGSWDLIVRLPTTDTVRQLQVETATGSELASGSIFRLAGDEENDRLSLGSIGAGELVARLEGQDDRYLEPDFALERSWPLPSRELDWLEPPIVSTSRADGRTRLEIERPPGMVPEWLELVPAERVFSRRVAVFDLRRDEIVGALGEGILYALPPQSEAGTTEPLTRVRLKLGRARGDRLRIEIDDGDASPLDAPAVRLGQRRPYLVFPLDAGAAEGEIVATLYFGGDRVDPPRFGLDVLLERLPAGTDVADFVALSLDSVVENPLFSSEPALAWAQRPGAGLAIERFRFERALTAAPSPEGLNRLSVGPRDLATLRDDLGDLRLVDGDDRQWPYLLERRALPQEVPVELTAVESENGRSRYRLDLGDGRLPVEGLTIESPAPWFDRAFELSTAGDGDRRTVATGRLQRLDDSAPVSLRFDPTRSDGLELEIQDGDDAPLEITAIRARVPSWELFFPAPAGDYRLLLGAETVAPPRYELESVRPLVLAARAGDAELGERIENPAHRAGLGLDGRRLLLWIAILLAVAVLGALTLRLARQTASE